MFTHTLYKPVYILKGAGWLLAIFLWILMATPPSHALSVVEETLLDNGNIQAVSNNPTQPTRFTINAPYNISFIETYHWNSQQGKPPGTISLRHSDGTQYGPWAAQSRAGQWNTPNAYWFVSPFVVIKPGTYTVVVSDPASWSHNNTSGNRGFAIVRGFWSGQIQSPYSMLGATVTDLKFFEAGDTPPAPAQRQFVNSFSKASTRRVYYQLSLTHPAPATRLDFTLTARYYNPDGSIFGEFEEEFYVEPGWVGSLYWDNWGWATSGNWPVGTYTVRLFDGTTEITRGTFSIVDGTPDLPPDQWLTRFPIGITETTVNDFLPSPTFKNDPFKLRRAYDPFGMGMDWFQSSRIITGRGGLRVTDVFIDNMPYWMDMRINLNHPALPLQIIDFQPGKPFMTFPHWNFDHDLIDFRMSRADFLGPPPRFTIFDMGAAGLVYDLDFTFNGSDFVFSDLRSSGYIHYLPNAFAPQVGVITNTPDAPVLSGGNGVCFSNVPYGAPLALFNVGNVEGQDYLNINYCNQTLTQAFDVTEGVARGTYAPPGTSQTARIFEMDHAAAASSLRNWFSRPSREEQLQQCIRDQASLTVGLQRDNQLGDALFNLATSFAGELKLGNKTLDAAKEALLDGKDVIGDLVSGGKMDANKMSEFILKTLLKNATPKEHEEMVKKFFDNKIPEHIQTLAEGSGTAMERQYKTALLAITKGLVKTYFPISSALAESVVEGQQWAIETMADEDIRILYDGYKSWGGDWDWFSQVRTKIRPNQSIRIKQILQKQGKTPSDANVELYLKNLFQGWHRQEQDAPRKQQELTDIKNLYDDDIFMRHEVERLMPNASECERLLKVLEWLNNAQLDVLQSMAWVPAA